MGMKQFFTTSAA